MSLDELSIESGDAGINASESPTEKSEKQKESSRRAQAQLQKVQKDEKKAKADNDALFHILLRFIQNPLYSDLIPEITLLLQNNFPSRFLLFLIAGVYPEASYYLLEKTGQEMHKKLVISLFHYNSPTSFSDSIHTSLREWITVWLTAGEQFIVHPETSIVLEKKFSELLSTSPYSEIAKNALARFFQFFFTERNVIISLDKSRAYGEFILSQLKTTLESHLLNVDDDLIESRQVSERDLFGI